MHCKECDELLTDNEAIYKNSGNDKYLNLCSDCIPIHIDINYGTLGNINTQTNAYKKALAICGLSKK